MKKVYTCSNVIHGTQQGDPSLTSVTHIEPEILLLKNFQITHKCSRTH